LAYEWGERIPIGIFYRVEGVPTYEEQVPALKAGPLVKQPLEKLRPEQIEALRAEAI
jgi:2-oxoglutarate ferredoxin oxidoreductase subunit beta